MLVRQRLRRLRHGDLGALAGLSTAQGPLALNTISGQPWANFGTMNIATGAMFMNTIGQQMSLARGGAAAGQRVALAEACDVAEACEGQRDHGAPG